MNRVRYLIFWAILCFLPITPLNGQDVEIPNLSSRVTDLSGLLSDDQKQALESKLEAFETRKGSQVILVIVPTTGKASIEQYSMRLAEAQKIGRKGVDDGVILLIARNDRELRIEVGYGLEGAIPDASAQRIIDEYIVPRFKNGDYYGGADAGLEKIMQLIQGEPLPQPEAYTVSDHRPIYWRIIIGRIMFVLSLIGLIVILFKAGADKKTFLKFCLAFIAVSLLTGLLSFSMGIGIALSVFGTVLSLIVRGLIYAAKKSGGFTSGSGNWRASSFSSSSASRSSSSSSWSSGSSFGGSSFSGGGGSFGGGGASGSW